MCWLVTLLPLSMNTLSQNTTFASCILARKALKNPHSILDLAFFGTCESLSKALCLASYMVHKGFHSHDIFCYLVILMTHIQRMTRESMCLPDTHKFLSWVFVRNEVCHFQVWMDQRCHHTSDLSQHHRSSVRMSGTARGLCFGQGLLDCHDWNIFLWSIFDLHTKP